MKKIHKKFLQLAILSLAASSLSACVVAATSVVAANVAGDSNSLGVQLEDTSIETSINSILLKNQDASNISVKVWRGNVLFSGVVSKPESKEMAVRAFEQLKNKTSGVLYNYIIVKDTTILQRASQHTKDLVIKSELASKLLLTKEVSSLRIDSVVDYGRVFLFGSVDPKQQKIIGDIARHIAGVDHVYTFFQ